MRLSVKSWAETLRAEGREPDPRFSFANERTFLAWIRTALALIAGGVAMHAFASDLDASWLARSTSVVLVVLGAAISAGAFSRWLRAERAMRRDEPLPFPQAAPLLAFGAAGVGGLALVMSLLVV